MSREVTLSGGRLDSRRAPPRIPNLAPSHSEVWPNLTEALGRPRYTACGKSSRITSGGARGFEARQSVRKAMTSDMHLTPSDVEKLLLSVAGMVARDRLSRGVALNYPESVALLSTWVIERAREGATVSELMVRGREVLTRDQVMGDVIDMLVDVQVEATFPDGRKLVTLHHPIA